jgi:hypothetical protein
MEDQPQSRVQMNQDDSSSEDSEDEDEEEDAYVDEGGYADDSVHEHTPHQAHRSN